MNRGIPEEKPGPSPPERARSPSRSAVRALGLPSQALQTSRLSGEGNPGRCSTAASPPWGHEAVRFERTDRRGETQYGMGVRPSWGPTRTPPVERIVRRCFEAGASKVYVFDHTSTFGRKATSPAESRKRPGGGQRSSRPTRRGITVKPDRRPRS
jgi:hypothetical protein